MEIQEYEVLEDIFTSLVNYPKPGEKIYIAEQGQVDQLIRDGKIKKMQ